MTGLIFLLFVSTAILVAAVLADSVLRGKRIAQRLRAENRVMSGAVTVTRVDRIDDIELAPAAAIHSGSRVSARRDLTRRPAAPLAVAA